MTRLRRHLRLSRFGLTMLVVCLLLAGATTIVVARGDQVDLAPIEVTPSPALTDVSTRASLRLRFARPMQPRTVEARLRLDPPVAGRFQWTETTLTFVPSTPLRPATDYQVVLAAGIEERQGRQSRTPVSWSYRTRAPSMVAIRRVDGVANLWRIDAASGQARPLTTETVDVTDAAVAPDGASIAFTRRDSPTQSSLWRLDVQSSAVTRLTSDGPVSFSAPAWSPDGGLIVFERRWAAPGMFAGAHLFHVRADGAPGGLVYGRGDEVGVGARWSPDGTRLALFDSVRQAIVIQLFFTRDRVILPRPSGPAFDWSPDGHQLAIEAIRDGPTGQRPVVDIIDPATGASIELVEDADAALIAPAWSPDGRRLAIIRRPASDPVGASDLLVLDLATRARHVLALPSDTTMTPGRLAWSPDGRQMLLGCRSAIDPAGEPLICRVSMDDGQVQPITDGSQATWLP